MMMGADLKSFIIVGKGCVQRDPLSVGKNTEQVEEYMPSL